MVRVAMTVGLACSYCGERMHAYSRCQACGERAYVHDQANSTDLAAGRSDDDAIWSCRAPRCTAGGHVREQVKP